MKHLRLYEEYTTTTNTTTKFPNLFGTGQPPSSGSDQTRIPLRPGYNPTPPTSGQPRGRSSGQTPTTSATTQSTNNLIQVYFYPDKEQKEESVRWGWINLKEFDKDFTDHQDGNPNVFNAEGYLWVSKEDAKNLNRNGKYYGKILFSEDAAKVGGGSEKVDGVFLFLDFHRKKEVHPGFENVYNIKFWNFIRDRYYEKNASGRLVRKISKGGFTDNSSVDTPDKFA